MTNQLEELTAKNRDNYELYLKRMSDSMKKSTKGLIPYFCMGRKKILDVGCADGAMMYALKQADPECTVTGIDLNKNAVGRLESAGMDVHHCSLAEYASQNSGLFDAVILSSVLHEISSYDPDEKRRFTAGPVLDALKDAYRLLEKGGIVIVRDGLEIEEGMQDQRCELIFEKYGGTYIFERFLNEGANRRVLSKAEAFYDYRHVITSMRAAREFMCTYTWGMESFEREKLEQFGILTMKEWKKCITDAGFALNTAVCSKEEYEKYLSPKVKMYVGGKRMFPDMTAMFTAYKPLD